MAEIIGVKRPAWPVRMEINGKGVKLNADGSVEGDIDEFIKEGEGYKGDLGPLGVPLWLVLIHLREEKIFQNFSKNQV